MLRGRDIRKDEEQTWGILCIQDQHIIERPASFRDEFSFIGGAISGTDVSSSPARDQDGVIKDNELDFSNYLVRCGV